LEDASLLGPIWEYQSPLPVLDVALPLAKVASPILPGHLSEALPHVYDKVASVGVSRLPSEYTRAVLVVIQVISLISV
jgi:hypothetical protein